MIAEIKGNVVRTEERAVILSVGGFGIRVFCTPELLTSLMIHKSVSLFTYLAVREDALDLYGFTTDSERILFELIISIPGIGPKKALAILALAPVATLKRAIINNDASYLTKVSGIGKKNAEKIVLELKDKISKLGGEVDTGVSMYDDKDALDALMALGYSQGEAREALKNVSKEIVGLNNRIKAALKQIGKN